jgi:peptide/nickel transport system permease protein
MTYLAHRLALGLFTLWLVTLVSFVLLHVAPGDAVSALLANASGEGGLTGAQMDDLRQELGLHRSLPTQYGSWLAGMLHLNAGTSLVTGRPVLEHLGPRIAVTLELAMFTVIFTVVTGISGGLAATRISGSTFDSGLRTVAFLTIAVPTFWIALIVIIVAASWTGHFLALGFEPFSVAPVSNLVSVIPAALILTMRPAAILLRLTRASTLEAEQAQHFLLARSKGVARSSAIRNHAFRTALLPIVTAIGAETIFLLGGAVVVEQVFGLPGLGRALVSAALARDFPVVQALVMIYAVTAVVLNLAVDAMYVLIDPRLRGRG